MNNQVAQVSEKELATAEQVVPAGYKQTEVGVIPEDWQVCKIGELAEIIRGASPRPKGDKRYYGGNVPRLMVEDVTRDGKFVTPIVDSLTEAGAKLSRPCPQGTLTLVCSGTVGIPSILAVDACIHDGFLGLSKVSKKACIDYLYHFFLTQREKFNNSATHGGVFTNLTTEGVKEFLVALPVCKKEQTAIANALSDMDALLGSLEALIAKKQAIKTATMQQLLTGRTRLPQFATHPDGSSKGYKTSELGEIPEDWDVQKIGTFTDCTAGGTPSTSISSYWGGSNPWMSSGELHLKRVFDVVGRITDLGLANSSTKYVPAESVLIGLAGQGKTRGTVAISKVALCTNQSIAAIFPSSNYHSEYLYYNLDSRYEELRDLSTGDGGRGGLNLTIIRNLALPLPDFEEQTAIATILSDMDEEIQVLEQRLAKTRDLKQGMMQQLLTGKIRLIQPVAEH